MAGISSHRGDLAGHPDELEMRDRFSRTLQGRDVVLVDTPVFLVGLYCAISPWVANFSGVSQDLTANNLVLGLAIALMGLCLTMAPARMYGLSWAMCVLGVWLIISPWVVTSSPSSGTIWSNVLVGAITCLLGLVAAVMVGRRRPAAGASRG